MNVAIVNQSPPAGVVTDLYLRTKALHLEAERSGIVNDILRGQASLESYTLFLRNLLPAYQTLETALERFSGSPTLTTLSNYKLNRAAAIEKDLLALSGSDWEDRFPLLPEATSYEQRILFAANEDNGERLIAHAYTRYLGDLSGGLIMKRLLARSLELSYEQLTFYDFPGFPDLAVLKKDYRSALDRAGTAASIPAAIVEEGAIAFSLNIDLSLAVQRRLQESATQ